MKDIVMKIEGESFIESITEQCSNDRESVCMRERVQDRQQKETLFGII